MHRLYNNGNTFCFTNIRINTIMNKFTNNPYKSFSTQKRFVNIGSEETVWHSIMKCKRNHKLFFIRFINQ